MSRSWGPLGAPPYVHLRSHQALEFPPNLILYRCITNGTLFLTRKMKHGQCILLMKQHRACEGRSSRILDASGAAKFVGFLLDLDSQLAGGRQDQHAGAHARVRSNSIDVQEARQQEAAGLATASLGNGHQIPALQGYGPGLRLNWRRRLVASASDLFQASARRGSVGWQPQGVSCPQFALRASCAVPAPTLQKREDGPLERTSTGLAQLCAKN